MLDYSGRLDSATLARLAYLIDEYYDCYDRGSPLPSATCSYLTIARQQPPVCDSDAVTSSSSRGVPSPSVLPNDAIAQRPVLFNSFFPQSLDQDRERPLCVDERGRNARGRLQLRTLGKDQHHQTT